MKEYLPGQPVLIHSHAYNTYGAVGRYERLAEANTTFRHYVRDQYGALMLLSDEEVQPA